MLQVKKNYDVIVIGAGAAGMMCAAQAGQRGRNVLLLDHYHRLGEKIRISGGGRCNFTNFHCKPENFISQNPHFCRSALARYTPQHFITLVEKYKIPYHEKKLGQLFCDNSAQDIIDMLKTECDRGKVDWHRPYQVNNIEKQGNNFSVETQDQHFITKSLVVATGGLAVPKIGATPFGYKIAEQFGLNVIPPRPALVPLTLPPETLTAFQDLAGVSIDASVSCSKTTFRENILFTHRGLSGPAILQISSYWNGSETLSIDLLPNHETEQWLAANQKSSLHLNSVLSEILPKSFVQQWGKIIHLETAQPMNQLSNRVLHNLSSNLHCWQIKPSGTQGYNKAEVTLGGVDTTEISSKTMESIKVKNLYFIGEVLDVTGHLGGFNFQWAWSSGHAAGQVV